MIQQLRAMKGMEGTAVQISARKEILSDLLWFTAMTSEKL